MNKKRRVMVQIRMRLHYFGLFPASIQRRKDSGCSTLGDGAQSEDALEQYNTEGRIDA
jgi:hypothetical protein